MDLYIVISLAMVFGLPAWWLYLAFSGLRDEKHCKSRHHLTLPKENIAVSPVYNSLGGHAGQGNTQTTVTLHQKVLDTDAVAKGITLEKIGKHEEAKARTSACNLQESIPLFGIP